MRFLALLLPSHLNFVHRVQRTTRFDFLRLKFILTGCSFFDVPLPEPDSATPEIKPTFQLA